MIQKKKMILCCLASFLLGMCFLFLLFLVKPELAPGLSAQSAPSEPALEALEQDPFQRLERMHESLAGFSGLMNLEGAPEILESEDESAFYYEISGIDQTKLSTRVEEGQLTIKGDTKKSHGAGGVTATMQSSFQRTFTLPPNVDETKMEMSSDKDKVILRFPKRS